MSVKRIRPPSLSHFKLATDNTKIILSRARDFVSEDEELEKAFFKSGLRFKSVSTLSSPRRQRNRELIFLNKKQIANIILTENNLLQTQNRKKEKEKETRELRTPSENKTPEKSLLSHRILKQPSFNFAKLTQDLPILTTETHSSTHLGARSIKLASPTPPKSRVFEPKRKHSRLKLDAEDSGLVKSKTIDLIRSLQDRIYGANLNQLKKINALFSRKGTSEKEKILQETKKNVNSQNFLENSDQQPLREETDFYQLDTENQKIQKVYKNFDLYEYNPLSDNFQFTTNPDKIEIENILKSLEKGKNKEPLQEEAPKPKINLKRLDLQALSKDITLKRRSLSHINKEFPTNSHNIVLFENPPLRNPKQEGSRTERLYEKTRQKILKFPDLEKNNLYKTGSVTSRVTTENRDFLTKYKSTLENIF